MKLLTNRALLWYGLSLVGHVSKAAIGSFYMALPASKPNHQAPTCPSNSRCRVNDCGDNHHTLLHQSIQSASTAVRGSSKVYLSHGEQAQLQLVSVLISGQNGKFVETVALLDSGSDVSIIHESLAKKLGLRGRRKTLMVRTISGQTSHSSRVLSVNIRPRHEPQSKVLHIKQVWTVPNDAFQGPSQAVKAEWKHVKDLCLPDIAADEVQLLIGLNVPEAHVQLDTRSGESNQPIAIEVNGPLISPARDQGPGSREI